MSNYTIPLYAIDKGDIFDFSFVMYGVNEQAQLLHKQNFIDRFYAYYYFNEINSDNVEAFNRMLERKMALVLERYNKLYEKASELISGSLTNYERQIIENKTREDSRTIGEEGALTNKFLDTPSVPLGQTIDDYATSITQDSTTKDTTDEIEGSEDRTLNETYQNQPKVDVYEKFIKAYKDLDEELIKEFKHCFMLVY